VHAKRKQKGTQPGTTHQTPIVNNPPRRRIKTMVSRIENYKSQLTTNTHYSKIKKANIEKRIE
jgi:hypothetical protein